MLKQLIKSAFHGIGYEVCVYDPTAKERHLDTRKSNLLRTYGIDLVLDVGANVGQFGLDLRRCGYQGRLVSFEPLSSAYSKLKLVADLDPLWSINHCALGSASEKCTINVASNSMSSSLLDMLPAHKTADPASTYVGKEEIEVKTLDSVFSSVAGGARNVFLKVDTQGFEKQVIEGAEKSLERIDTIQLEMSLVPLYQNEPLFSELCVWLEAKGYRLVFVEPGFFNNTTGEQLQLDGIFHRYRNGKA